MHNKHVLLEYILYYKNKVFDKMTSERKETIQYITAVSTLSSGILMCFLSFFLNNYIIHDSVLWYFGQTAVLCGSIFGISVYVNGEIRKVNQQISKLLK